MKTWTRYRVLIGTGIQLGWWIAFLLSDEKLPLYGHALLWATITLGWRLDKSTPH